MSVDSSDEEFFDAEGDAEGDSDASETLVVSSTAADVALAQAEKPITEQESSPGIASETGGKADGAGSSRTKPESAPGVPDAGNGGSTCPPPDTVGKVAAGDEPDGAMISALRHLSVEERPSVEEKSGDVQPPVSAVETAAAPTTVPSSDATAFPAVAAAPSDCPPSAGKQPGSIKRPPPPTIAPYASKKKTDPTKVANGSSGGGGSTSAAALPPLAGISTQGEATQSQSTDEAEDFVSRYRDGVGASASDHGNFVVGTSSMPTVVTASLSDQAMAQPVQPEEPMSDTEILEGILVKNLDTGESIPLSEAEKLIPNGVNPLALHIMRLTSEFVGEGSDADDQGARETASHAAAVQAEAAAKLVKQKGKMAFKRFKGKVKSVKKALEAAGHGDNDSDLESENGDSVRFKASGSHRGPPYSFDDLTLRQDLSNEHSGPVWTIRFSTDGRLLASAGQDLIVRVWVLMKAKGTFEDMRNKYASKDGSDSGSSSRSTPDKPTGDDDNLFDPKPFCCYSGHSADILDLAWSKNYFLLSASFDKTVRLWHVSRQECLACFKHTEFVTGIAFHPRDDRYFLSGSLDARLRLWNIPDKKVALWNEVEGSGNRLITAANFVQNGKYAAAGTYDGRCLLYETEYLKYHTQIHVRSTRGKNARGRKITGIVPMPGEDKILISSNDSRVRLYDLKDLSMVCKYKGAVNRSSQIEASFSSDGSHIMSGSENGFVYLWRTYYDMARAAPAARRDVNDAYESFAAPVSCQSGDQVTATAFAPVPGLFAGEGITQKGEVLVAADFKGCIHVYSQTGKSQE